MCKPLKALAIGSRCAMNKRKQKMGVQLFVITFVVIAVMIGALLAVHSVFFERFYLTWKTNKLQSELSAFSEEIAKGDLGYTDYLKLKERLVYDNNASVSIICEDGTSFEQRLRENQKWIALDVEYEDGITGEIVLSEYDIYTNLTGQSISKGDTFYILDEDAESGYAYNPSIIGTEVFEQMTTEFVVNEVEDVGMLEDWQMVKVENVSQATQEETEIYTALGVVDEVYGSFTYIDTGQIQFNQTVADVDGEQYRIYLDASLQPVDEASAAISSYYPWFFLVAVVTALMVAFIYSRCVAKPIIRISKAADEMSQGRLNTKIKTKQRNEIGVLADSLNSLSSNLKRSMSDLKNANKQLLTDIQEKEKQEQVRREFTANVSHDLKTPLGVMRCYTELLRDDIEPEKREEYFTTILGEIDKMNKMVMQMLQLAKAEAGDEHLRRTHVDIKSVLSDAIMMFEPVFEDKSIGVQINGFFSDVLADAHRIEQAVVNLLSNASEYALPNSQIDIIGEISDGGKCRVSIENACELISQSESDGLFKRFVTLDKARNKNGTGLGLAICAAIFELHGFAYGVISKGNRIAFWFEYDVIDEKPS